MIQIEGLSKTYKDVIAVSPLDLTIKKGELFALLGVNGAGKTTTIGMLSGLIKPTGGDAFLNGASILTQPSLVKKVVGVSPQETAIAPQLTVFENLAFMCGIHGFSKERQKEGIKEMVERFNLQSVLHKRAGQLSGGWQRRLSVAMALISEPQILFLDEPTLGLDVLARADLWEVIRALKGKVTIVLTTHYLEEAEALSDRIGMMKEGKLIALGTADELKKRTGKETFEAAFIEMVRGDVQ